MNSKVIADSHEKPGEPFEKLVAAIQKKMDPNSVVIHNEKIRDRNGFFRQFDVVVRGKVGGHEVLCVIECRDRSRSAGIPSIEAFSKKAASVNADKCVFVSKKGFTKPAVAVARDYNIIPLSLLPNPKDKSDNTIGLNWYAEIYRWSE